MIKFLIIFFFMVPALADQTFKTAQLQIDVHEELDRQIAQITGRFFLYDKPTVDAFLQTLVVGKDTTVVLNSGGGSTTVAKLLFETFNQLCHGSCRLTTAVRAGEHCASSCITVFMAGRWRMAAPTAVFGFHQASIGTTMVPGACEVNYERAGISSSWVRAHENLFSSLTITPLKPSEITGSNIVTDVSDAKTTLQ